MQAKPVAIEHNLKNLLKETTQKSEARQNICRAFLLREIEVK